MYFLNSIQCLLLFVSTVDLIIFCIPVILKIQPLLGNDVTGNNIYDAMRSTEVLYALILSLSMSLPLTFELFLRFIISPSYKSTSAAITHNLAVLLSLVIPDAITLFYVIPYQDTGIMSVVLKLRFLFISWAFLSFLNRRVFDGWSPKISSLLYIVLSISSFPPFYKVYCSPSVSFPLEILIGFIFPLFCFYILCKLCLLILFV